MSETTEHDDKALEYYKKYTENHNLRKYFTGSPLSYLPKIDGIEIDTENNPDVIISTTNIDVIITHESSENSHEINESHMSSPTCNRKLEWDNGADIGYANCHNRQNDTATKKLYRSASLSALTDLKNRKVEFKLDETFSNKQSDSGDNGNVNVIVVNYSSTDDSDVSEPHNPSSDTVSSTNVIIASSTAHSSNSGETHIDKRVSNFAVTLQQLKDKIGLPDAHSTPREMSDTPCSYSSSNIAKRILDKSSTESCKSTNTKKVNNNERVVNLCLTKPVTIECVSSDLINIKETKLAGVQTELSNKPLKIDIIKTKPKSNQNVVYFKHHNKDTVSTSQTDSNEIVNCDDTFEYHKGTENPQTSEEPDISKSVELIKRLVKSKKYDISTKKRYIKKIVQKISEGYYLEDSTSSSELFQPKKQRVLDIQTFTENIVPETNKTSGSSSSELAGYCNWREDKTTSERLLESRFKSMNKDGDCLINFAENERKYQLTWINSEITHLSKLRNLLATNESKPSCDIKKLTSVYKVQHSSEDSDNTTPVTRKYVIETEIGTSRPLSDNINFNLDGKMYHVINQASKHPPTVSGDIKVSYSDTSTHIKVSAHCKLCNSFPCCCVCLRCCKTPCDCRESQDFQIGTSRAVLEGTNANRAELRNTEQQISRTEFYKDVPIDNRPILISAATSKDIFNNINNADAQVGSTPQSKDAGNDIRPQTVSAGVQTGIPKDLIKDSEQQYSKTTITKGVYASTISEVTFKSREQQFSNTNLTRDASTAISPTNISRAVEPIDLKDLKSSGQQTSTTKVCTDATCEFRPIMASAKVQAAIPKPQFRNMGTMKDVYTQQRPSIASEQIQVNSNRDSGTMTLEKMDAAQQFNNKSVTKDVCTDQRPTLASQHVQVSSKGPKSTGHQYSSSNDTVVAKGVSTDLRTAVASGQQTSDEILLTTKGTQSNGKKFKDSESESDQTNSLKRVFDNCSCTKHSNRCECKFVQKLMDHFKSEESLQRRFENAAVQAQRDTVNNESQTTQSLGNGGRLNDNKSVNAGSLRKEYQTFSGQSLEHMTRGINTDASKNSKTNSESQKSGTQTADIDLVTTATQVLMRTNQNTQTKSQNGVQTFATQTSFLLNESVQTSNRNPDTTNEQATRTHPYASDAEASDSSVDKRTCCKCKVTTATADDDASGNEQKRTYITKGIVAAGVSRSDMSRNGPAELQEQHTLADSSNGTSVSTPTSLGSDSDAKSNVVFCICCKSTINFDSNVQMLSSGNKSYSLCCICSEQRPMLTAISSYTAADYQCSCYKSTKPFCTCTNSNKSSYCSHCQNKLRHTALKRGGIAYSLRLDSAPLTEFQKNGNRKHRKPDLEEIRIKVPDSGRKRRKKTDKDKENYHKRQLNTNGDKSSEDGREVSKSNPKSYTLQEYLRKNRPEFVDAAEHRRNAVNSSRDQREENRDELKLKFLENNLRKELDDKILFTEKEMKEITKRHYKKLPEVQRRLVEQRQERLRNADKLLKNIFAKKIQRSVLKGERNFRIDTRIVSLPG